MNKFWRSFFQGLSAWCWQFDMPPSRIEENGFDADRRALQSDLRTVEKDIQTAIEKFGKMK